MGPGLRRILAAFVIAGLANFFWFWLESVAVFGSGNALSDGTVVAGHYFIYEKAHTGLVEVTQAGWEWSWFHTLTVELTFPLVLISMFWLGRKSRRPSSRNDHPEP